MPPPVPVGVRVLAGLREPEEARNVEALVLRVVAPGVGALRHADLEVPPLLAKALGPLVRGSVVRRRRRVLGGVGIVVLRQLGHLRDPGRRRRRRHRLHPVGREITRELVMVLGIDEVVQGLAQQLVLRKRNSKSSDVRV